MKKFRFQSILEYRKNLEEEIQQEFLAGRKKLSQEEKKLFDIRDQITDLHKKFQKKVEKNIYPAEIELHQKFLQAMTKAENNQKGKIRELELSLEKKRRELLQAIQEKKIMGKLKEKVISEWQKEQLQENQKILDEKARNKGEVAINVH